MTADTTASATGGAPSSPAAPDWAKLSIPDSFTQLGSSDKGLTSAEAAQRLARYGSNVLEEKKTSQWAMFGKFFWGPMPWMIEAAALMSILVKDWVDFAIILALLLFNAVLGFFHERAASNALDALKSALAQEAQALRDSKWQSIPAATLVPGDVVRVRLGNVVPADVKLVAGDYLDVDQSALTGESLPVSKKAGDEAYSGSIAKKGEMTAVVTGTGAHTFFGRTAGLVQRAGADSQFARANNQIGDALIMLAVFLAVIMVSVQLHRGDSFLRIAEFALLLLVAAIPVAMPAVLSMTMAMGAKVLADEKAIVSRLEAIEELAGISILFSDKTGTLTQNKLTLGEPVTWGSFQAQDVILAGSLASKEEDNDPIDLAVIGALKDQGVLKGYQQVAYVPFDPVAKRTEATLTDPAGKQFKASKGMPPVIFELSGLAGADLDKANKVVSDFAAKGYRTLAAARTDETGKWSLVGILPMYDPPRPDSKETIARAVGYGLKVKMVTGDDVEIGRNIAKDLGLGSNIIAATSVFTGDVTKEGISDQVARNVDAAEGFGRVFPEHKWAIVKSAQQLGHLVGMTGDGVNDAPALKQANVGVAVSGATEAARAAAGLILTAPGLSVIIRGIEEARRTFARMMGYAYYRIAMTISIMLFIVLVLSLYDFQVLTPVMIILLALLDDVPVMLIAFDHADVSPRPAKWDMPRVLMVSALLALVSVVQSAGLLRFLHHDRGMEGAALQTAMFLQLVVAGHLLLFSTRASRFFFELPWPEFRFFTAIMATQGFAAVMATQGWLVTAIGWEVVGLIWAYNLCWLVVLDLIKVGLFRMFDLRAERGALWQRWFHGALAPGTAR